MYKHCLVLIYLLSWRFHFKLRSINEDRFFLPLDKACKSYKIIIANILGMSC